MMCLCGRDSRGFGWSDPDVRNRPRGWESAKMFGACSMKCLDIICVLGGVDAVKNLTRFEEAAVEHASDKAGEYLDGLGKTDLAKLSRDEWLMLIYTVFTEATGFIQTASDETCSFDAPR